MRVSLDRPLVNDAAADAASIIAALKRGTVYSAIDALAAPAVLEFSAHADGRQVHEGERIVPSATGVTLSARTNAGSSGVIVLRKDGAILTEHPVPALKVEAAGQGTYRVEVYLSTAPGQPPIPWIVSNPIYVRPDNWGAPQSSFTPAPSITRTIQGGPWHAEKDDQSAVQIAQNDPSAPVQFTFQLGSGDRAGRYAALGIGVGKALTERTHLAFRARASASMRISVQARNPQSGNRWQRSIYLDSQPRDVIVRFADMTPVGSSAPFDPSLADTVLFVVDTTNTLPGTQGSFMLENLRVER
jgi:hypothetical protein